MARRRLGFWRRFGVALVKPTAALLSRRDGRGMANIPKDGPLIIVANHISHADPFLLACFIYDSGRWPAFLIKSSPFELPLLGAYMRAVDQTPVYRGTAMAGRALEGAVAALGAGKCVVVYPEGTTTKEPDLWPMRGKTGAARLWLATGAPVIPVVTWGPQQIFDPRTKKLSLRPRRPITVVAGPPMDLSRWSRTEPNGSAAQTAQEITDHIMLTLRDMLAQIRGGTAPPLWSPLAQARTGPESEV